MSLTIPHAKNSMKIYLVGGAVRDKKLGLPIKDRDWVVVGAKPQEMLAFGYKPVGKDFPVFLHPVTHEEHALARIERKIGQGYTGFACEYSPTVTLEEDLKRRDLTINAMAETENGELIDPFHGLMDIKKKQLRHVSEAFSEDPLRVLRVARFLARFSILGFHIAPETLSLMKNISATNELHTLSRERIWQEIQRALTEAQPWNFFITLTECDAWSHLFPELNESTLKPFISSEALVNLQKICFFSIDPVIRFSSLFFDAQDTENLFRLLKAPLEYLKAAKIIAQYHSIYRDLPSQSAEKIFSLLKNIRAFQQPERLQAFIQVCGLRYGNAAGEQLTKILVACKEIDPQMYLKQGLQGANLGAALEQEQIRRIQNIIK